MMKGRIFAVLMVFMSAFVSSYLDISVFAEDERKCLYNSDFESGTLEDWNVMGSCKIDLDSGLSYGDSEYSMAVSDRNLSWEGPTVNLLPYIVNDDENKVILKKGEYYTFSSYLYAISEEEEEPIRCTIKYSANEGGANYLSVADLVVETNKWVEIKGTVQIPDTELTAFDLYYEAYSEYLSFNIDSFNIMEALENEKSDEPVQPAVDVEEENKKYSFADYENDFEDGNIEPFIGEFNSKLSIANIDGNKCLKVSEREFDYAGPAIYLSNIFTEYDTYLLSLRVYYESDITVPFKATIIFTKPNGEKDYKNITYSDNYKSGEWNLIENRVVFNETLTTPELIIETEGENGNVDFYIDDFSIKSAIDHKVINKTKSEDKSNFENGIDGFEMYNNASAVRDNTIGYKSKSSLKVSKRMFQDSGVFKFINFVNKEQKYLYSAYVLSEEDNNIFQMVISYAQNGIVVNQIIAEEKADAGEWINISGVFSMPENSYSAMLIIDSPEISEIHDFYLDQVRIVDYDQHLKAYNKKIVRSVFLISCGVLAVSALLFILIKKKRKELKIINSSNMDEMTKVYTRNAFQNELQRISENIDKCKSLYVTACDLNGLKMINDTYGHSYGDEAIIRCANVLKSVIGKKGKVYRTGGDEFVCLTTEDFTENFESALKKEAENYKGYPFSAAFGCSSYREFQENETPDFEQILKAADQKMFDNKAKMKTIEKK